jgi:hypothetical protein
VLRHPLPAVVVASATLVLVLAACGSAGGGTQTAASPAAAACADARAAHKAYVVVQHAAGRTVQKCVGFDAAEINGEDLMQKSRIEFQAQSFSGIGKAVCQLDNEPAQFTECFPKDRPYWALYTSQSGGPWQQAQAAYPSLQLKDGDAVGWEYQSATASPPPPPLPRR